ncbi:hypothetical protein ACKS0A_08526 [Histoplasma ohiense]
MNSLIPTGISENKSSAFSPIPSPIPPSQFASDPPPSSSILILAISTSFRGLCRISPATELSLPFSEIDPFIPFSFPFCFPFFFCVLPFLLASLTRSAHASTSSL